MNTMNTPHFFDGIAGPTLIVTRHAGAVEWLRRRGIEGEVLEHASAEQVAGRRVVGVLPLALAAAAGEVWAIDLPDLAPADRGRDLTPEEMDAAGARLVGYRIQALGEVWPAPTEAAPSPVLRCARCGGPAIGTDEGVPACEDWPDCQPA